MFDINSLDSQTIVFGGLTLIGLALVGLLYRQMKFYGNHTNDVISRNTDAWIKNASTNQRLTDVIEKWHSMNEQLKHK